MPRAELKKLTFLLAGVVAFGGFLAVVGARAEPPTIAMIITAAALALLLSSLYRMVVALTRPATEVALEQEAVLDSVAVRELREEKRRVLRAINELQFDHDMGKLSDEDYRKVRELYELRAIEVMRALEAEPGLHPRVQEDLARLREARGESAESAQAESAQDEPAGAEPAGAEQEAAPR